MRLTPPVSITSPGRAQTGNLHAAREVQPTDAENELTIGQRIARARRARGLTQFQLANLVGLSHSWLTKAERGERPIDRMSLIVELARALKVDVTELTGQEPNSPLLSSCHPPGAAGP